MLLLLVAVVSLGLPAWQIVLAFRRGVDLRRAPRAFLSKGVFRIMRTGWYALLMICVAVFILPLGINGYQEFVSYSASPRCVAAPSYDCRQLRPAVVTGVATQTTRSGQETTVDFAGAVGSATFYSDAVGPSAVAKGTTVTVEVWHGKVTAIVLDDVEHHSFATQSDAWILIPLSIGMFLLGVMSLALTAATTESPTKMAKSKLFIAPTANHEPAPQPSPAPQPPPAPEIPLHGLDEARLNSSSSDRVHIRPSFHRWLRQMKLAIPTFVILVVIGMLRGLGDNSQWLLWVVPVLLVAIAAGWYLWFRNVSLFSGSGYFGRTNLLGQRVVFRLATLRRVLLRMVATNYSATPRLILVDDGKRILFQVNPNSWEPGDLQRFLDSLNAKPEEDLNPVGYWSLKRQLRDGQA
jgi:hypothetical protein